MSFYSYSEVSPMVHQSREDDHDILYTSQDLVHNPRAAQLQRQLTHLENSSKGHCLPPYSLWSEEPVSPYHAGSFNLKVEYNSPVPYAADFPSPWSTNLSSTSGGDSPRSSAMGMGFYMSPPYQDEIMIPSMDLGGYPSPGPLANIAPYEVHHSYESEAIKSEPVSTPLEIVQGHPVVDSTYEEVLTKTENTERLPSPPRPVKSGRISKGRKSGKSTRVSKPSRFTRISPRSAPQSATKATAKGPGRAFVCSFAHYGCQSTFVSKNEWKRHVTSQHIQLGFFRCDVGDCNISIKRGRPHKGGKDRDNRNPNDFNRKDLFTQHQRRMHAPWVNRNTRRPSTDDERHVFEQELELVRDRCWHEQRKPPPHSQCGFCGREFQGPHSWDERMEHVGRHFEKGDHRPEAEDTALRNWAINERIIQPMDGRLILTSICGG